LNLNWLRQEWIDVHYPDDIPMSDFCQTSPGLRHLV